MSADETEPTNEKANKSPEMSTEELLSHFKNDPLKLPDEDEEFSDPDIEASNIDALIEERDEIRDRLMRALAETENMRKRAERDRRDAEVYGGTKLARDMLSVYDNMNRAIDAIDDELREKAKGLIDGLDLTRKELVSVFEKHKIVKVEPEFGDKFDPQQHQAMFEAPVPNAPAGTVIQVMNAGFTIGERLLRPAQVGVSSTPASQVTETAPDAE